MKSKLLKLNLLWMLIAALFISVSCSDDDDDDTTPPVLVEDGLYVKGDATGLPALDPKGLMTAGINEVNQAARTGMYEMYVAIDNSAAGFNIVKKAGSVETVYGPATFDTVTISGGDQPNVKIQKGTFAANSSKFTVPESGLFHIALDMDNMTMVIIPVTKWAILGGATENGWGDTDLPLKGTFSKTMMEYEATGIVLRAGDFKLRHSGGWKVELLEGVKCNTNFGGACDANTLALTLVPGGSNYPFPGAKEGIYTVNLKWQLDGGYAATLTKTGDVEPLPEYPEALYMIGDGVGTWDWAITDLPMVPVNGHANAFWKIVWMNGTGGFKFCPEKQWGSDFGVGADPVAGVGEFIKGTNNCPVPADSGYYMVMVDFDRDSISVAPVEVYLIGDVVGSWDADRKSVV